MKTHNELIAEFMGFKFHSDRESGNIRIYDVPGGKDLKYKAFKLSHLKFQFDTSWDWLMPVVEKISLISTGDDDFYYPRTFGMRDADGNYLFRFNRNQLIVGKTLIEATYGAVVEFIKWYNDSLT